MIQSLLKNCGLHDTQQIILLHLLQHGESIASLISKQLDIKRTTVYATLETLIRLGLVVKQQRGNVTYFKSTNKENIPSILKEYALQEYERVRRSAEMLEKEFDQFEVQCIHLSGYSIDVLDTGIGVNMALDKVLRAGDFNAIFNPQVSLKEQRLREIVVDFLEHTSISQPYIREIAIDGPITDWYAKQIYNPNHQLRILPSDKKIISDMIFSYGSVYILHYEKSQEIGIKVTQSDFYQSMTEIFEILWKEAKRIEN